MGMSLTASEIAECISFCLSSVTLSSREREEKVSFNLELVRRRERDALKTEKILLRGIELGVLELAPGSSDEDLISSSVSTGSVMSSVRDPPRVVRDHPDRVKNPSDEVVVSLRGKGSRDEGEPCSTDILLLRRKKERLTLFSEKAP